MALNVPESMDKCLYFTNRNNEDVKLLAWVYRKECPKCKKDQMGKPVDPKTGRPKSRSLEYVCPSCGYTEEKAVHEESLTLEAITIYKRKSYKGVQAYILECQHCKEIIPITKKLKKIKKKK